VNRRRLALAAAAAALGLGTLGAASATADPLPVRSAGTDGYIACLAVDGVAGTCIRNPLPDPSLVPSPGKMIDDLLPS
jgi:hypothetical protein